MSSQGTTSLQSAVATLSHLLRQLRNRRKAAIGRQLVDNPRQNLRQLLRYLFLGEARDRPWFSPMLLIRIGWLTFSGSAVAHDSIVDQQHHDRAHDRDDHAVDVQTGDT